MAEPKKKTVTKKETAPKKAVKKTAPKKTSTTKTPSVSKNTTVSPAKTVKKPVTKKTAPTKKAAVKVLSIVPEKEIKHNPTVAKKSITDMSIFATILAVFVVTLVVLGGYVYSRQMRAIDTPAPQPIVSEPQRINISSSVVLTPEVMTVLESLVSQIAIGPDEVLVDVRKIENAIDAQTESPEFFRDVQVGDFVFEFKSSSVLFRPNSEEIITTGILPKEQK